MPELDSIDPNNGTSGTNVTVNGNGFSPSGSLNVTVLVEGVAVPTLVESPVGIQSNYTN